MHEINFTHEHELDDHDFLGCCKNCQASLDIIKPHIMGFAQRIRQYDEKALTALDSEDLYRLYQILDDLAHMDAGEHLADLILDEPEIQEVLPMIRSYYSAFFSIHEKHLAIKLLESASPWEVLKSFPLYNRYKTLVKSQIETINIKNDNTLIFIGCGPVPMTLILMSHLYGIKSIGLDSSKDTVELSKKVILKLGLENSIQIIHGDDSTLEELSWDMVLVAALAEPKARIFKTLYKILKGRDINGPVIYRTYTGMRAVLYRPVQPGDIEGFRIIKKVLPTGRVNNTTVFAELA